jgi:hypothetical protein
MSNYTRSKRTPRRIRAHTKVEVNANVIDTLIYFFRTLTKRTTSPFLWGEKLIASVPVGLTKIHGNRFIVRIDSLETYRQGFLIRGQISRIEDQVRIPYMPIYFPRPKISFQALDESGYEYRAINGYIEGVRNEFRFVRCFVPRLHPKERYISLIMTDLPWDPKDQNEAESVPFNGLTFVVDIDPESFQSSTDAS